MNANFKTLVELWERSTEQHGPRELFGTKRAGVWHWITYAEFKLEVDALRAGLSALGVGPGDRVALIAGNRVEWAAAAYATFGLCATFVPMYEQQPLEDWAFILKDCEAKVVLGSTADIVSKIDSLKERLPSLVSVVGIELPESDPRSYKKLLIEGRARPQTVAHPSPDQPACFIYTSGTTGQPKGVVLSHWNIASNVIASGELFPLRATDRSLAFLPWAHAFGQTCELHMLFSVGCGLALNDEIPNLVGNLAEAKPTILIAVPRIFNRIYDGVNKQMTERPKPIQALFRAGIRAATKKKRGESLSLGEGLALAAADKLIFSKVRQRFGGRLRFSVSGSAALAREVAEFVDALGIAVYEGYGLTEASPVVTANCPDATRLGTVGKALPRVRIEIDLVATGDAKNGEIIVYGDNVMRGYHHREEEERQMLQPDGGLRTGDMGFVDEDGYLHITGRIKEQYKLENGKYVVPSPLEEDLKLSPYIANVLLFGLNRPFNVALVVLDEAAVTRWAREKNVALKDITRDAAVKELIEKELAERGQNFRGYEKPRAFELIREDFTVENGLLTPSLKVRRKLVLDRYLPSLEALYSSRSVKG
ncbi:MAG TPA: long-chain fatty acid--CoA ligase [Polyangiaceae bacterium]|jgi:long-chain acyl-CoA synthetase|nr:long-chain fatty acid--CoA ligase [Polyangiaceae bacterium]